MRLLGLLAGAAALAAATSAFADTTLLTVDRGSYGNDGSQVHGNYDAGGFTVVGDFNEEDRSYFVFDLAGISETILSAELQLFLPSNGYQTDAASVTYELHDFTGSISGLIAGSNPAGDFADLGDGTVFGSVSVSLSDSGTTVDITLDSDAIAALNAAAGGQFALGGIIPDITADATDVFAHTGGTPGDGATALLLQTAAAGSVPEPESWILMVLSFASLAAARGRAGKVQTCRRRAT